MKICVVVAEFFIQTDRYDEANSLFSQYRERAQKFNS